MVDTIEAEALLALTALSAPECEACHKPLKPGQMACCNRVYCPFCRKEASAVRCPHVVAYRRHGEWIIPGVPPTVDAIPLELERMVEWSDGQKRAAFGPAFDLAHHILGEGLSFAPTQSRVRERLVDAVPGASSAQFNAGGRYTILVFHADANAFVRDARRLLDAWMKGLETLRSATPEACRHLVQVRSLEPYSGYRWNVCPWTRHSHATFLAFSPDGAQLAVGLESRIEMRAVPSGELLWEAETFGGAPRSAVFASGGATLAVMTSTSSGDWETHLLDAASGAVRATLPASNTTGFQTVGSQTLACLHDGRLLVDAEGRNVRLTWLGESGAPVVSETIPHRAPIKCFGASSDGETFATIVGYALLLWRVPR